VWVSLHILLVGVMMGERVVVESNWVWVRGCLVFGRVMKKKGEGLEVFMASLRGEG